MSGARLAEIGSLLADGTRSQILTILMDGRAYTGRELATAVGVAPSTASEHLARLLDAGMVTGAAQGRHRYFALPSPEIAELLETIGASPTRRPPSVRAPAWLAYARTCYDHLAASWPCASTTGSAPTGISRAQSTSCASPSPAEHG